MERQFKGRHLFRHAGVPAFVLAILAGGMPGAMAQELSLVRTLRGHSNEVGAVAFSQDGRTLASGSSEYEGMDATSGEVKLWDAATGRLKHTLNDRGYTVAGLAFSPDGKTLASGDFNNDDASTDVCLWRVSTRRLRRRLAGEAQAPVAFSPDGRWLATGDDMTTRRDGENYLLIRLCDPQTGHVRLRLRPTGQLTSLAFSPNGKTLVSESDHETDTKTYGWVQLWDMPAGKLHQTLANDGASAGVFSPDGFLRASISGAWGEHKTLVITVYDAQTGQIRQMLRHRQGVYGFAFSPDSQTLVSGSGTDVDPNAPMSGRLDFWDVRTGRLRASRRLSSPVLSIAVSPDGKRLATGMGDDTVKLWRLKWQDGRSKQESPRAMRGGR